MRLADAEPRRVALPACVAYCFITIPSLGGIFTRLNLYLHSGQVALANQCLSQGEPVTSASPLRKAGFAGACGPCRGREGLLKGPSVNGEL